MFKHWDEWGEVVIVKDGGEVGPGLVIRWNDGTLSIELAASVIEILGHGSRAGGFVDIDMVKEGVQDCAIRTCHGIVVRVCEWDSENSTHVEFFNKGEFPRDDEAGSAECYFNIEKGDLFDGQELVKCETVTPPEVAAVETSDKPIEVGKDVCPKCRWGGSRLQIWEDAIISREVQGLNDEGILGVESMYESDGDGDNARFYCDPCGHDCPIPDDSDIEYV